MNQYKRRVFEIIQIGKDQDIPGIIFDFFIAGVIMVNLFVTLSETFETTVPYMSLLKRVDAVTILVLAVAFRMLQVVRIFRLFRINTYYDAFNVITDVLNDKKDQIFSSLPGG